MREERFFGDQLLEWFRLPRFPQTGVHFHRHMPEKPATDERRSRQRMPVRVPVKVRHAGAEHAGLTRDLSSVGIFLYSESGMKAGSKLELVIMLPPGLGLGPGGWTLCEASVVRVEESEGKGMGVAATIDSIDLLPEIS
jgi:PilZ domain-containing protein